MTKKRRRLPVITTCRLCTYCNRPVEREMRWECFHGDTPSDSQVNPDEAPPDWCPLP